MTKPATQTNCIAFCCRVLKILGVDVSKLPAQLKTQLKKDAWDEKLSGDVCHGVKTLLKCFVENDVDEKPEDIESQQEELSDLSSLISFEEEESIVESLNEYNRYSCFDTIPLN